MSRFAVDPRRLVWLPPTMAPCSTSTVDGYLEHPARGVRRLPARRASTGWSARRSTWARGRWCWCRAASRRRFGGGVGATPAPAGRSSAPPLDDELLARVRAAVDHGRPLRRAGHRLAAARLRAAAVVGEGRRADPGAVRRRRRGRPGRPAGRARRAGRGAPAADCRSARCATGSADRAAEVAALLGGVPGVLLADRRAARGDARAVRGAGRRRARATPTATTAGTWRWPTGSCAADPESSRRPGGWWSTWPTGGGGGGDRVVAGAHRRRRRGHGGQAVRRAWPPGREGLAGPAGHQVPGPGVPADHLRPGLHRAGSARRGCASGRLGRKRGLALREHALGLAALDRLAAGAPLWRRHELVFAILACESEPVDPRL